MFEFLKNIFGKPVEHQHNGHGGMAPIPAPGPKPASSSAQFRRSALPNGKTSDSNGRAIAVPLQAVLSGLPLELKGRVVQNEVEDATISVSLEKVLSQLSSGAVKISFGELRSAAPQIFSAESDHDQIQVPLPLSEILSQVNPALLVRRPNQKRIEVPNDISSPFGDRGQGLVFAIAPPKPEAPASPRHVTPAAPIRIHPKPAHPAPGPLTSSQSKPVRPPFAQPAKPASPVPMAPIQFRSPPKAAPAPSAPAGFPPTSPAQTAPQGLSAPAGAVQRSAVSPAPVSPVVAPSAEADAISVSLSSLAAGWPEALRQEIVQLNLADARVLLPAAAVEQGLKHGRVAFPWKTLRSWINPAPLPAVSVHDNAPLELPLRVVAPLFLTRQKTSGKVQQKLAIDENIPNLFFGFPQPDAAPPNTGETAFPPAASPHAVAKPVDTNYYVWDDNAESAKVDETEFKRKPTPGTTFLNRYATPNEVVSRAAALDGVVGALIALPDGLMVASRLAPDLNGETLAAFLPHIFGNVSKCTKELRMGELNNLNFTVGNVPWKIFRVNAIYFAAFGRVGQPLPTAQLAALAGELDRKKQ